MRKMGRNQRGTSLAEFAAAMVVVVPLLVCILYVTLEASYAYLIKGAMNDASRQASRDLAKAFGKNAQIATDRSLQNSEVFDKIRIPGMVITSAQFSDADFKTAQDPPTVTVTVKYASNQFGLPAFPKMDPLRLTDAFSISATSTYRLE